MKIPWWTPNPITNISGAVISSDKNGSMPKLEKSKKDPYPPIMISSPCATLSTRNTPNTSDSPAAARPYSAPVSRPKIRFCATIRDSPRRKVVEKRALHPRIAEQFLTGAGAGDAPPLQQIGALRQVEGRPNILLHEQDGDALRVDLLDHGKDAARRERRESQRRLVEQQDRPAPHQP